MKKRNSKLRRGMVAVLVAVSITSLMGVVAIALDGSLLHDQRRRAQAGADAAALAAVDNLFLNWQTGKGQDVGGTANAAALANAAANGYNNDGVTSVVTVNIPPTSGNFAGQAGYAEVIIQFNQKRGFSGIFGSEISPSAPGRWRAASGPLSTMVSLSCTPRHPVPLMPTAMAPSE